MWAAWGRHSTSASSAEALGDMLAHPGDDVASNKCTIILYSVGSLSKSQFFHQRKSSDVFSLRKRSETSSQSRK